MKKNQKNLATRRSPVQKRSMERLKLILDETQKLVDAHEDITTTMIANKAGIPVGSLYQYFPDVKSILSALFDRTLDEIDNQMSDVVSLVANTADLESAVTEIVESYAAHFRRPRGIRDLQHYMNFSGETFAKMGDQRASIASVIGERISRDTTITLARGTTIGRVMIEVGVALMIWASLSRKNTNWLAKEQRSAIQAYFREQIASND